MKSRDEGEEPIVPYTLTEGPLPKSMYTYQLEAIARKLLMDNDFTFNKENNEYYMTIDDIKFNWTEIIKYANLDQIELNRHDFYLYSKFIRSATEKPSLHPDFEPHYIRELYQDYYRDNRELPEPLISFQEMQAINVYTGGFYLEMNALLRGEFDFGDRMKTSTKEAIIQSIMCASGLRKIPETTITDAYRGGKMPSTMEHNERIKAAEKHGVIQLSGFVSSSTDKEKSFSHKPVAFHFTNLKGVYIAPISQEPSEKEFLISPTQVQLNDYRFENNRHYFDGRMVSDLASRDTRGLDMGSTPNRAGNIRSIEPKLSDITSYEKLQVLLQDLSPAHCKSVCEAKKDLIASAYDLACLLEFLSSDQREAVYDVMMKDNRLIEMIKSGNDFNYALKFLSLTQYTAVFDAIKARLPEIIQPTTNDLGCVLQYLTPTQCTAVCCEVMREKLLGIIQSGMDLRNLFRYLTIKQFTAVIEVTSMKDKLLDIIKTARDINCVMRYQRSAIILVLMANWPDIIKSCNDCVYVMGYLNQDQRTIFFDAMKDALPRILTSDEKESSRMLALFSPEQRDTLISMKELTDNVAKTASDIEKNKATTQQYKQATRLLNEDKKHTPPSNVPENT